jgi:hypothetical protein
VQGPDPWSAHSRVGSLVLLLTLGCVLQFFVWLKCSDSAECCRETGSPSLAWGGSFSLFRIPGLGCIPTLGEGMLALLRQVGEVEPPS